MMRFRANIDEKSAPNRGKLSCLSPILLRMCRPPRWPTCLNPPILPTNWCSTGERSLPTELDAPEAEIAALAAGAALHDLGWMRRVDVRGGDRFRWLSGMVTNTVNDLFPNTGAWNLVLNAQGHIQGDVTVWRDSEESSPQRRNPAAGAQKRALASR